MAMEWLPATVNAASAPVTKLIEVVAAGCGKIYEPTGIRRRAKADADAKVTHAENEIILTDIQIRGIERQKFLAESRQNNVENIAAQAATSLPDSVAPEPVAADWSRRFFADCEDVSDVEMQGVWAKILAGEVTAPGSFSFRTLAVMKNLSKVEAELFNTICKNSFLSANGKVLPYYVESEKEFWEKNGLNFTTVQDLTDSGLISHHAFGLRYQNANQALLMGQHASILFNSQEARDFPIGEIDLTVAGREISRICEFAPDSRIPRILASKVEGFDAKKVRAIPLGNNQYQLMMI